MELLKRVPGISTIISALLAGVGVSVIVAKHGFDIHGDAGEIVRDIGIAMAIAGVLGVTFEGFARKRLVTELSKQTADVIDQDRLRQIFGEVADTELQDLFINKPFLRENHILDITLELTASKQAHVTAKSTYDVQNFSWRTLDYTIEA